MKGRSRPVERHCPQIEAAAGPRTQEKEAPGPGERLQSSNVETTR